MSRLSFESAREGDHLPELKLPPITRLQLALYCGGSGDHNPIHVDTDFARRAGVKDVFAHGMLSMAYMGRLVTSVVPQSSVRSFSVRFIAITWVADEITVTARVVRVDREECNLTLELACVNQNGETTLEGQAVLSFGPQLRLQRGHAGPGAPE
jgi:acyl dehydratase